MKLAELRNLSKDDLSVKLAATKEELAKLHYSKMIGQVDKPHKFKLLRKTVARIHTLLKESKSTPKDKK